MVGGGGGGGGGGGRSNFFRGGGGGEKSLGVLTTDTESYKCKLYKKASYHFLGVASGLYLLNFFLHSMISRHLAQTPPTTKLLICLVFLLVS